MGDLLIVLLVLALILGGAGFFLHILWVVAVVLFVLWVVFFAVGHGRGTRV